MADVAHTRDVYKYIPSEDSWELTPERLSAATAKFEAMLISLGVFPRCNSA